MTVFAVRPEDLHNTLATTLGERVQKIEVALGEVTVHVSADHYLSVMQTLRDAPGCQFEQLIDLAGVDYSTYGDMGTEGSRFGLTVHVLLDQKSESTNRYVIGLFQEAGVSMRMDGAHAIAHNKVIVIDAQVLVTGSFNFTNSAETRNAENVLILRGDALAQAYRDNWRQHWAHARP